jgi:hypothetical protein
MRRSLAVAVLLAVAGAARGEEPAATAAAPATTLDLTQARVLVSPGWPEALRPFLPEAHAPEPIRWPLPDGPVLLLGLPETDDAAEDVGAALGVIAPGEDLAGGYVVSAWHDGKRPVAVVLAADAAAPHGARFELEPVAPAATDRSREVTDGSAAACTCVVPGRRVVRPRWRERALWVRGPDLPADAALRAAGARANRLWVDVTEATLERATVLAERARRLGIETWPVVRAGADATDLVHRGIDASRAVGARALVVRHDADPTAHIASALPAWREAGIGRVVRSGSGRSTLRATAGVEVASEGEGEVEPGVPVHLVETWGVEAGANLPSRPRDRDATLGERFEGLVVPDGPMAEALLLHGFAPEAARFPADPVDVLRPLVPTDATDAADLLRRTGAALAAAANDLGDRAPWASDFAKRLVRDGGRDLARATIVPIVEALPEVDGRLDDRGWAYAARCSVGRMEVLALSDGRDLCLGVRGLVNPVGELRVTLDSDVVSVIDLRTPGVLVPLPRSVRTRTSSNRAHLTIESRLGHAAVRGDAHPGRVVSVGLATLVGPVAEECLLVVGR